MLKAVSKCVGVHFEWILCTNLPRGHKSDFQYCMSRKLIYLSSWLTFALHFRKPFSSWLALSLSPCRVFLCAVCRSSLMVIKQWPEKLTEKLFVLHFFNWINYCESLDIFRLLIFLGLDTLVYCVLIAFSVGRTAKVSDLLVAIVSERTWTEKSAESCRSIWFDLKSMSSLMIL